MPKLYQMWTELRLWIEQQDDFNDHGLREVLTKMDELESEYE